MITEQCPKGPRTHHRRNGLYCQQQWKPFAGFVSHVLFQQVQHFVCLHCCRGPWHGKLACVHSCLLFSVSNRSFLISLQAAKPPPHTSTPTRAKPHTQDAGLRCLPFVVVCLSTSGLHTLNRGGGAIPTRYIRFSPGDFCCQSGPHSRLFYRLLSEKQIVPVPLACALFSLSVV